MNSNERRVRAHVINGLCESGAAPSVDQMSVALEMPQADVTASLRSLAGRHLLAMQPRSDAIWMVHPFSGIETDFVVNARGRTWYANPGVHPIRGRGRPCGG